MLLRAVLAEIGTILADERLVEHLLRRDVHEREVDGAVLRRDVSRDRVDMPLHGLKERAPLRLAVGLIGRGREGGEGLHRELRVDRHEAPGEVHDGVDTRAAAVRVLQLERARGQGVLEHALHE